MSPVLIELNESISHLHEGLNALEAAVAAVAEFSRIERRQKRIAAESQEEPA
jgi:hypothetical protein